MSKTVIQEGDEGVRLIVKTKKGKRSSMPPKRAVPTRSPVHVVYGGADRYNASTSQKLGELALRSLSSYASNFAEFATAIKLPGFETLPAAREEIERLEKKILRGRSKAKAENYNAWLAWTIYQKTIAKLQSEPVEDFRIDFEDGYGFRSDEEEDKDAKRSARELAKAAADGTITPFCGFRIKSFAPETYTRAIRTLDMFLAEFIQALTVSFPSDFVVTLPKITHRKQVRELAERLRKFEKRANIASGTIGIEVMIETPEALFSPKGIVALNGIVNAGKGRVTSAHFGAYDYTASLGISSAFQHIRHPACDFARQMMLASLTPLGIRLSDSVTTLLPVAVHSSGRLNSAQRTENRLAVHAGWAEHFLNVRRSMSEGFYQSWDLHPNQLPARFAAVYAFYLTGLEAQAQRLRNFLDKATQAALTGNVFDDSASAEGLMNSFRRAIACGAITENEGCAATSLTASELRTSFQELAASR